MTQTSAPAGLQVADPPPDDVGEALTSLPWVRQVKVDFSRKEAVVTAVAKQFDEKAILKALKKEGYEGEMVKEKGKK